MTKGNERGVAVVLAEEYADTIDATAKVAMASILAAMMDRRLSTDPLDTSGDRCASGKLSDTFAPNTAMTETAQISNGLIHKRSRMRCNRNCHLSRETTHFMCTPAPCYIPSIVGPAGIYGLTSQHRAIRVHSGSKSWTRATSSTKNSPRPGSTGEMGEGAQAAASSVPGKKL
jgi:hypothetical protein